MGGLRCGRHRRRCARRSGRHGRRLHAAWARRQPVVVELHVDPARFRHPQSIDAEPWTLAADAEPWHDRLHFLTWANTYDAHAGAPVWWWGVKAARLDGSAAAMPAGPADVTLGNGEAIWVDGGPQQAWASGDVGGFAVVHSESVDRGCLVRAPAPVDPRRGLAADQLVAVAHRSGAARVIAPAGSGKTRVLTERLRHLHRDRGVEPGMILAVAYNKQAQLEIEARTTDFRPHVRTLNSLGLWVLAQHRGSSPPVVDEREVRRLVEALVPGRRPRRANTDPIGPYVEGLASIRLGLRDPEEVESSRDDVPGLAELFPAFDSNSPSAAWWTSTSRSTPPSSPSWVTASSGGRCNRPAATCSSTSSRTSRRRTSC